MRFSAELVRSRPLSPSVKSLVLRAQPPETLCWEAGQYVELELEAGVRKPYSIACAMGTLGERELEVAVGSGSGSELFEALQIGSLLTIHGPFGSFKRSNRAASGVFLAAGTGLAPFRAMLQDALGLAGEAPLLVLYGCRVEADILWREELVGLSAAHPHFGFEPTLSQPDPTWTGRRGYVQQHLSDLVAPLAARGAELYVCGPSSMVTDCVTRLVSELGIAGERIFVERV
jgi:NAD(P)H-flavin reductase